MSSHAEQQRDPSNEFQQSSAGFAGQSCSETDITNAGMVMMMKRLAIYATNMTELFLEIRKNVTSMHRKFGNLGKKKKNC